VPGTVLLLILSGQRRYPHITASRSDTVNPSLLDMRKVSSEDDADKEGDRPTRTGQ
jgi:hypothetical protein